MQYTGQTRGRNIMIDDLTVECSDKCNCPCLVGGVGILYWNWKQKQETVLTKVASFKGNILFSQGYFDPNLF